ncbi:response regulator [Actinoplanes sp. NPDC051346]|uniref:response regulator n=1 Tax=Actinoplanes sp. NPDC051346 TaxID=3155048 RepID=UPI0034471D4A
MSESTQERPTVLVVDDEDDLRDIMRRMLERRGFSALIAGNADQALTVCRDHPGDIDVLVTDLTLPDVSGGQVARDCTQMRPAMGVVFISGLPKDMAVAKGLIDEDAVLVKKPFTADLLLTALRSMLAEKAPTT